MNRYKTVIVPAYDGFIESLSFQVDIDSDISTIGLSVYDDISALVRELVDKAYNAGYADCEDKHQQKARLLKALQRAGGTK